MKADVHCKPKAGFVWEDSLLLDRQLNEGTHDIHALILGHAMTGIQGIS